jgi:hypothetical protein
VPPVKVNVPGLVAVALAVGLPPQPVLVTVVVLFTKSEGYTSENASPVTATPLTLVNVIVIAVGVLAATVEVAKDLLT